MEIRWPLPGEGYRTMTSSIVTKKEKNELVPLVFPTNIKVDPVHTNFNIAQVTPNTTDMKRLQIRTEKVGKIPREKKERMVDGK